MATQYNLDEYLWLVVVGCVFGFFYAFGIGANDVANSFASTVASGSLTLKQAVYVAGVFEFSGSFFLGAQVTATIRGKVFTTSLYSNEPEIVMLGMFTSLLTGMIMLQVATMYGLPVSTTHTIVGCIMGFSIVAKGFDSIVWSEVKKIILSWLISPLVSGFVACLFFFPLRMFILRHDNAFQRAYWVFPLVLTGGIGIDLFYILFKGLQNTDIGKSITLEFALPFSFGVGALAGVLWAFVVGPWAKTRIDAMFAAKEAAAEKDQESLERTDGTVKESEHPMQLKDEGVEQDQVIPVETTNSSVRPEMNKSKSMFDKFAEATYGQDLHKQSMHESSKAEELWDAAEKFDPRAEQLFTYLQVFTACLNSFAHGANDVANAIGPIAALVAIYQEGELNSKSPVPKWILAYGGIALVLGLLIYGYNVMKTLGYKVTPLSPSRGSCAELASSLFVVTASFLEIPVSSTQCITGAVLGVGLASGIGHVDWLFFLKICCGWVGVFFTAIVCSAGVFAFMAYSPTLAAPVVPV